MSDEIKKPAGLDDDEFRREDIDPELAGKVSPGSVNHYIDREKWDEKYYLAGRRIFTPPEREEIFPEKPVTEKTDTEKPDQEDNNWKKELRSWLVIIAAAAIIAIVLNKFVFLRTEIISGSMIPTIEINERVIANRLAYLLSDPKRGDVVFFANPDNESETFVKRIIGLPGDKVEIKKGKVYINDSEKPLSETYLKEKAAKEDYGPYYVPAGHYFLLGDNRNISRDSRFWSTPYVAREKLYGKALFGYRIRKVESAEY